MTETFIPDDADYEAGVAALQQAAVEEQKRNARPITRTRGVMGGAPCIAGTRVPTSAMWAFHTEGYDTVMICREYPHLTHEQIEAAIRYEAKRHKRRDPKAKAAKNRGRAQKRRGYRAEVAVVTELGPSWERVPLSGALGGRHKGDVRYIGTTERPAVLVGEVKRRAGGCVSFRRYLAQGGGVDFAVIVPGSGEAELVVLTLETFKRLLERAGNA